MAAEVEVAAAEVERRAATLGSVVTRLMLVVEGEWLRSCAQLHMHLLHFFRARSAYFGVGGGGGGGGGG